MSEKLALLGGRPILREPLKEPNHIGEQEIEQAIAVLKSGQLSSFVAADNEGFLGGAWVKRIEQSFKDYFGTKFAISMNSATSGLFASVYALGISPGDEVIVSPYTMSATAAAVLACSGVPVFVDVDCEDFCIDTGKIEAAITAKTKAIIAVHLFGNPVQMERLMAIATRHNLAVIEDCAQAPGAEYHGKYVGTMGDVGVFSLNRHKTIQSGEGGVIVTDQEELALKLRLIRNHAETVIDQMGVGERYNLIGWNYRMTELEAAIGSAQIKRLNALNALRISNADYLREKLNKFSWIIPNRPKPNTKAVYYRYPFRFIKKNLGIERSMFAKVMQAEGFPLNQGYLKPLYLQSIYQKKAKGAPYLNQLEQSEQNYQQGLCPVVEKLYREEFMFSAITHLAKSKGELNLFIQALEKVEANVGELEKVAQEA